MAKDHINCTEKLIDAVILPVQEAASNLLTVSPSENSLPHDHLRGSNESDNDSEELIHGIDSKLSEFPHPNIPLNQNGDEAGDEVYEDALDGSDGIDGNIENYHLGTDRMSLSLQRRLSLSPRRLFSSISKHTPNPINASMTLTRGLTSGPLNASVSLTRTALTSGPIGASVNLTKSAIHKLPSRSVSKPERTSISDQNIEGISKSFVGFLTTASVYAGFQDIEEDGESDVKKIEGEHESLNDSTPAEILNEEQESYFPTPRLQLDLPSNVEDCNSSITSSVSSNDETIMKKNTLYIKGDNAAEESNKSRFELSIVNRLAINENDKTSINEKAAILSAKLREDFDISDSEEFVGDYSCWLLGDVLLQGHLYVTTQNILFFAFLPKKSKGSIAKTGALSLQSFHSLRIHRKWAILRDNTFAIYANATDLYFPELVIDLRTALRAEIHAPAEKLKPKQPVWIKIVTENRTHWFQADNLDGARAWVTVLKKYIFASRNKGDQVAIKIPLQNILDLELTSVIGVTKNLRIKVIENADSFAIDDYFVMFFSKGDQAVLEIKTVIQKAGIQISNSEEDLKSLMDSELMKSKVEQLKNTSSTVSTNNFRPMLNAAASKLKDVFMSDDESDFEQPELIDKKVANTSDKKSMLRKHKKSESCMTERCDNMQLQTVEDTTHPQTNLPEAHSEKGKWSTKSVLQNIQAFTQNLISTGPISHFYDSMEGEDRYFVKDESTRKACNARFLKRFSLNDSKLLATYHLYLMKGLPTYGKLYIGENEICFRSTLPGSNTIMILPLTDIENVNKEQGFRFGYYGLVILIHGHEELFFEFGFQETRSDCEVQILKVLDTFKNSKPRSDISAQGSQLISTRESKNHFEPNDTLSSAKIRLFENKLIDEIGIDVPIIVEDHPFVKTEVKPSKPYRFTLLTIGSRGDVQPYISLGKALLKEGHKVKIVTHVEFKDWIESYGIDFDIIAGDPSELMALMVSHPSISYSFIKEAKAKFKSWIDDLLVTSWKACQNTDVLIESPSSIGGIHIAEKLKIPYFRAFTMPWTRTRAYPHAFMVPDQRLGGAYNYMTHVAFENGYWRGTSYQVNKWRVETLGLKKTSLANMELACIPFLYNMSPVVFPPSVDFPEWIKVTGYWFLDESKDYTPPDDLLKFIQKARDDGKKLVYIGFGSIVVENPKELTQAVVNAVLEADVRCILNKGWSDRLGSSKKNDIEVHLPQEVFNAGSVPHDWLFTKVDAAVHHGGSGTTGASLRFGLPTIIKPFFGDQKFYRVEDLGCGVALKSLNSKELAKALKEVTTNQRIIEKAQSIGKAITSENGVQNAIDSIYSMMDYAKKVSVRKAERNVKEEETESDSETDQTDGSWLLV